MASPTIPILVGGIFAWSIYRRIRRNIGRQPLRPVRSAVSVVIFCIISFFIIGTGHGMALLGSFGGGLLLGAILGFAGLRLTKFETTDEGHFYTPNTYIGGALSVLLIGRMLYRYWQAEHTSAGNLAMMHSPLTYFIIGLTFGYYIIFYIGLFIHTHDKKPPGA